MKLGSHEDALEDFNLLKLHERLCRLAQELRPERFRGLTWVDLRAASAMLVEESVQVPVKLMKQIMEKRIAPLHARRRRELVPTLLRVADCACSVGALVGLFQRLLFNKVLVTATMEGGSSSDLVAGVCAQSACDRWDRWTSSTSTTTERWSRPTLR